MEKKGNFVALIEKLERMEQLKVVDISVLEILDDLIKDCKETELFWIENRNLPIDTSFLLYHSTRNSRLVLEKMRDRFITARKNKENPHIISDSIEIVPILSELYEATLSLRDRPITPEVLSFISNRLRLLRNIAHRVSMMPSPEEEIAKIDKEKFKKHFSRFAETLQVMLIEA
ncbi:MAG: hypothetical protein H5T34_01580 [Candidatus Methanomethyliales bacterium]|nr:hypothetical protein [Candidatus Methanomethylicales archaeon]